MTTEELLVSRGLDPTKYTLDEEGRIRERPPAPTVQATQTTHEPESSPWGSAVRSLLVEAAPTLAGAAAFAGTLGAASTASVAGAPVGIPTLAAGGLLSALAAYGTGKAQEAILPDSVKAQLQKDQEEHPFITRAASLLPQLAMNRLSSPGELVKAVRGFIPGQIDDTARLAAQNLGLNAGISAGTGAVLRSLEGQPVLDPVEMAKDVGLSLLFGAPRNNVINRKLGLYHPSQDYGLDKLLEEAQLNTAPEFPTPTPEVPPEKLRKWDPDVHGDVKDLRRAKKIVDKELAGRRVSEDEYHDLLVRAAESNPKPVDKGVVSSIESEIRQNAEMKKASEALDQELAARAEKEATAKSGILSASEVRAQEIAAEQARLSEETRRMHREELQRQVDEENAILSREEELAREERRVALETRKREIAAREEELRRQQIENQTAARDVNAEDDAALAGVGEDAVAREREARLQEFNDAEYRKWEQEQQRRKDASIEKSRAEGQSKSKVRDVPEWMGRTSESREDAPEVDAARAESRDKVLTQGFARIFREHFAPIHGDTLKSGVGPEGVKGFVKDGEATVTPLATQDTPAHELFGHPFIERALQDPRGKKIVGQLLAELEASPDYRRWSDEARAGGKVDPGVKEYAAQLLGQRLAGDLEGPKYKTTATAKYQLGLLKRELKRMFKRATPDDLAELVQNAYVTGSRMRGGVSGNTEFQHDRSDKDIREEHERLYRDRNVFTEPVTIEDQQGNYIETKYGSQRFNELVSKNKVTENVKLNAFERNARQKEEAKAYDDHTSAEYHFSGSDDDETVPGLVRYLYNKETSPQDKKYLNALIFDDDAIRARQILNQKAEEAGYIPVPVFHGTRTSNKLVFDPYYLGKTTGAKSAKHAWFFSSTPSDSANYGGVEAYYLKKGKYKVYDMHGQGWNQDSLITEKIKAGFDNGYDVVVFKNFRDPGDEAGAPATHYAVNPKSKGFIKSAELTGKHTSALSGEAKNIDYVPLAERFNAASKLIHYSRKDVPEVPFKSNIARMVGTMKQDRFTKGQLEAEIRKNKSTMEEYDYRGLAKTLPEKLDKATVLKAVEEVAPKIERVNFSDKITESDPFKEIGMTRDDIVALSLSKDFKTDYANDPAQFELILRRYAKSIKASLETGYIDPGSSQEVLSALAIKGNKVAAEALRYGDDDDSRFLFLTNENSKLPRQAGYAYNDIVYAKPETTLKYDPVSDDRLKRYWTSNPNRSETTLRIPGADYIGRPRSKEHFSNDTFGWIRTSEGEAGGVPTKIGEEAQSDVTKDFRKRTERDEEVIRRGDKLDNTKSTAFQEKLTDDQKNNTNEFKNNIVKQVKKADEETLTTTPYLNSERRLLLKQLILEAERDGFKKIAWTTGDEQAKRNGRDVIDGGKIEWTLSPTEKGSAGEISFSIPGQYQKEKTIVGLRKVLELQQGDPSKVIDPTIGLKARDASEILARIKRGETSGSYEAISGEGYKNIYDREDVKEARRLGLDPKLEVMSDGVTRWTAEITPKAREEARYAFSRSDAPVVGSSLSRIRSAGPGGEYLADKFKTTLEDRQLLNGRFRNRVAEVLAPFTNAELQRLDKFIPANSGMVPLQFRKAVMTIREVLKDLHNEQRARGIKVRDYDSSGNTVFRDPKDNPDYNPSIIARDVYDELANRPESAKAKKLREDFLDYFENEFQDHKDPRASAEQRLDQMFPRKGGGVSVDYNAVRLAEGHGLPESWQETDIQNKWRRYLTKFSADLAYGKHLQADPVIRQLLNINSDGQHKGKAPKATELPDGRSIEGVNYETNPDVIATLHDVVGGRSLLPTELLAYSKLANAFTLGPLGKLRDIATVIPIAVEVGGMDALKAIPGAVMNLAENIAKAKKRGIIDARQATWFDNTLDNLGTVVDTAANAVNKYTGSQLLENVARGLSWGVGEAIAKANIDDPAFVKKFGGVKDPNAIADRITESIQGTYDARGTPTWIRESAFGPLFALNRWSIERFNNWKKNVYDEARDGNLKPLLWNILGTVAGSALVDELNELVKGKKPEHLTWAEWLKLDGEDTPYKLAAALSTASTTGVLGDVVYSAHQLANGRQPRGTGMPMLEITANVSERLGQMIAAGSIDLPQLAFQLAKDNVQIIRDLAPVKPNADAKRDVRVFKRIQGEDAQPLITSNPFEKAEVKELREASGDEFAKIAPKLISELLAKAKDPQKELESIKRSLSSGDNSFVESSDYWKFLVKLRGEKQAQKELVRWLTEKQLREAKGGVL